MRDTLIHDIREIHIRVTKHISAEARREKGFAIHSGA